MCRHNVVVWSDCVCEEVAVSPDPSDQCEKIQGSISKDGKRNRLRCAGSQSPANGLIGKQLNPPTVIEGSCGRSGCVSKEAGYLKKPTKDAFKDYLKFGVRYFNTSWDLSNSQLPAYQKHVLEIAFGDPTLSDERSRKYWRDWMDPILNGWNDVRLSLEDRAVKRGENPVEHVERLRRINRTLDELKDVENAVDWRVKETENLAIRCPSSLSQQADMVGMLLEAARVDAARSWVEMVEATVPGFSGNYGVDEACHTLFSSTPLGQQFF